MGSRGALSCVVVEPLPHRFDMSRSHDLQYGGRGVKDRALVVEGTGVATEQLQVLLKGGEVQIIAVVSQILLKVL